MAFVLQGTGVGIYFARRAGVWERSLHSVIIESLPASCLSKLPRMERVSPGLIGISQSVLSPDPLGKMQYTLLPCFVFNSMMALAGCGCLSTTVRTLSMSWVINTTTPVTVVYFPDSTSIPATRLPCGPAVSFGCWFSLLFPLDCCCTIPVFGPPFVGAD